MIAKKFKFVVAQINGLGRQTKPMSQEGLFGSTEMLDLMEEPNCNLIIR